MSWFQLGCDVVFEMTTVAMLKEHAVHVMRTLGKGHSEKVYHSAMVISLNRKGILHRSEVTVPIYFMKECVGFGRADLIVDDIVVEFKANMKCPSQTSPQLQKYMASLTGHEKKYYLGCVINFSQKSGLIEIYEERHMPAPVRSHKKAVNTESAPELESLRYIKKRKT